MHKPILILVFIFFYGILCAQDSTFVRYLYSGSSIKVPENCSWVIQKAFISSGDGYQIQISNSNFKEYYQSSEIVALPLLHC